MGLLWGQIKRLLQVCHRKKLCYHNILENVALTSWRWNQHLLDLYTRTTSFLPSSTMYSLLLSWNITMKLLSYSLFKLDKQLLNKETKIPKGREKKMVVPSESTHSIASYLQGILFCLLDILDPDSQSPEAVQCLFHVTCSRVKIHSKLLRAFHHFACHITSSSNKENWKQVKMRADVLPMGTNHWYYKL